MELTLRGGAKFRVTWSLFVHPGVTHFFPPPCAKQCTPPTRALFLHPGVVHLRTMRGAQKGPTKMKGEGAECLLPPPWPAQNLPPLSLFVHPGAVHNLCPPWAKQSPPSRASLGHPSVRHAAVRAFFRGRFGTSSMIGSTGRKDGCGEVVR